MLRKPTSASVHSHETRNKAHIHIHPHARVLWNKPDADFFSEFDEKHQHSFISMKIFNGIHFP